MQGFLEVVRRLIVCGADVNAARSDGGGTPLQIASRKGYYNVALILLKGGAVTEATHARPNSAASLPEQRMLRLLARWRCAMCDRHLCKEKTRDRQERFRALGAAQGCLQSAVGAWRPAPSMRGTAQRGAQSHAGLRAGPSLPQAPALTVPYLSKALTQWYEPATRKGGRVLFGQFHR